MKKWCLVIAAIIATLCFAAVACAELLPGQEYGWRIEDSHLCFYTDGVKLTGHNTINEYDLDFTDEGYLKGNGQIQEVGYRDYVYVNENNIVLTGWQTINGGKYYFFPENGMAAVRGGSEKPIEIDGAFYLFGDYGELLINTWGISYYGDSEGHPVTGYQTIDGYNYLFDDKGEICTGFIEYNGAIHYFGYRTFGEAHGWVLYENDWYYFDPETGIMQTASRTIDGIDYTFGTDGKLIRTGTIVMRNSKDGNWYGYDKNNNTVEGWQIINGNKYYFY
ncbi:MAG: hypothetical protein J6Y48_10125, partial [Clostridia bacterium]|nr:hypothetical protein [Clostridia bacterium]